MQISSTFKPFQSRQTGNPAAIQHEATFQPANQGDISDIGNSVQNQERWDYGRGVGLMFGAAGGAVAGTAAFSIAAAAMDFSGWGTAGAGLAGLVVGGAIGLHLADR